MPLTIPAPPALARINRVELVHTGSWNAKSGPVTFTPDDLASAVGAFDCPAVRRPVLKFGHDGNHGAGDPAIGWVDNLALDDDGGSLVGDFVGMPAWLATADANGNSVLTSAYPDRSIEGEFDYRCQLGHNHPFVVHAVALLGVDRPGVGTLPSLQDLAAVYGVELADGSTPTGTQVTVTLSTPVHTGAMVALVPSEADIARLVVDGGEPAEQLHTTLLFLGEAADWDDTQQQAARDALASLAAQVAPLTVDGFGLSLFNPGNPDRDTCVVLALSGDGLTDLHDQTATNVAGPVPEQHQPWQPHITLAYTDDPTALTDLVDRVGPVTFDRLRVAFAGQATDFPLGQPVAAAVANGRSIMPNPRPAKVAASVSVEDVRRDYYDKAPWSHWITEVHLDPLQLIVVDDESGQRLRVPVDVTGEDTFTFGEPVKVLVRYVDKPEQVAASAGQPIVYASRAESRPGQQPAATTPEPTAPPAEPVPAEPLADPELPAAEPEPKTEPKEDPVSTLSDVRSRLGLPDDADEATVSAAVLAAIGGQPTEPTTDTTTEAVTEPETPAEPTPVAASTGPALPDGVVTIDREALAELRRNATLGAAAHERQRVADRDAVIAAAMNDGKFAPARKDHWVKAWEADPEGTKATLSALEPGLIVPVVAAGTAGPGEPEADELGINETAANAWAQQLGVDVKELTRG
ncbi:2'-5' RNA ligase family protein [Micromonospora sp. NPDC050695]|uniref:2'-5' RNA ligase family protein n=1 Tax=Micromonospora sp. NPDC050695 TaxID=3154938 RepID=UPI0033DBE6B1